MKILFSVVALNGIGGTESSLINLLNNIDEKEYEIDLCVMGNYISESTQLPKYVNIVKGNRLIEYCCTRYSALRKKYSGIQIIPILSVKMIKKIIGYRCILRHCLNHMKNSKEYDVAISYSNDQFLKVYTGGCDDYILKCVKAKKKLAWIHNDARKHGLSKEICLEKYKKFDYIVNVSQGCKQIFDSIVPEYINKSIVVTNMLDLKKINNKLSEINPYDKSFNIVTVARIENRQKRLDRVIETCKLLINNGYRDFHWTIVGDGEDLSNLKNMASEYNILDYISFVGRKMNAIPYMQYANVFVQTSDYEAYSMVLIEALSVGCPCIVTNYDSADNIIQNNVNGWIVEKDPVALSNKISELMCCPELLNKMRKSCVSSCEELNKIAKLSFLEAIT